jgi:uncharacterized membrane protein
MPVRDPASIDPERESPAASNVRTMLELERVTEQNRSSSDLISDRIAQFAGSLGFVLLHVGLFAGWGAWNHWGPTGWRFDPYPFGLLTMFVSLEGVLIGTFVLIAQNRMSRRTERRNQLHLQIGLLTEQELTVALRLLRDIAARLDATPAAVDLEVVERLSEDTDVHQLAQTLAQEDDSAS